VSVPVFGGVEAGGTKFVCAIGTGPDDVRARAVIPTTAPGETMAAAVEFFASHAGVPVAAIGIASFGPIDLDPRSPTFGCITTTPKRGWSDTDVVGPFRARLSVPVGFDTDVNGAAVAEHRWGAARGLGTVVYLTVGTGIGGGALVGGRPVHGLVHPEMGHVRVPRDPAVDPFPGACPFHGDCLEGLASGPAMEARWGARSETLAADHPAWDLEARYLALGIVNVIAVLSPERVVLGGGVMRAAGLLPRIRRHVLDALAGYVRAPAIVDDIDRYIVPAALGDRAGVLGALALAHDALGVPVDTMAVPEDRIGDRGGAGMR
jgi:fructokinase